MFIPTVAVRLYRPIALALEDMGISAAKLFGEFDMPDPATTGWDVRLPLPQIAGVWGRLLEATGDPYFALRAAQHVDLTTCDVITYLEGNARTVETALQRKFEFLPLITDAIEWTLEVHGDEAAITLHERPARPPLAPVAEYLLGARHVFFRRFASPAWALRFVSFRHPAPEQLEPYRALFGVIPHFGAAFDQLVFDRSLLEAPMLSRDDALSELLRRYATPALKAASRATTVSAQVEALLQSGVDPGVSTVARELHVAPRTLQRSLSSEGTSYAEVAARMRVPPPSAYYGAVSLRSPRSPTRSASMTLRHFIMRSCAGRASRRGTSAISIWEAASRSRIAADWARARPRNSDARRPAPGRGIVMRGGQRDRAIERLSDWRTIATGRRNTTMRRACQPGKTSRRDRSADSPGNHWQK